MARKPSCERESTGASRPQSIHHGPAASRRLTAREAERIKAPDVNGRTFRLHRRAEGRLGRLLAGKAIHQSELEAGCRPAGRLRARRGGATASPPSRFSTVGAGHGAEPHAEPGPRANAVAQAARGEGARTSGRRTLASVPGVGRWLLTWAFAQPGRIGRLSTTVGLSGVRARKSPINRAISSGFS